MVHLLQMTFAQRAVGVRRILRSLHQPCNLQIQREDKNYFELLQTNNG